LARFQKVTFSNITDSLQTDHSSLIMHPFLGKQMKMTSRSNVQECIFTRTWLGPTLRSGLCYRKCVCRLSIMFVHPTHG